MAAPFPPEFDLVEEHRQHPPSSVHHHDACTRAHSVGCAGVPHYHHAGVARSFFTSWSGVYETILCVVYVRVEFYFGFVCDSAIAWCLLCSSLSFTGQRMPKVRVVEEYASNNGFCQVVLTTGSVSAVHRVPLRAIVCQCVVRMYVSPQCFCVY